MKWNPKNLIALAAAFMGLLAVVLVLVLAEKLLAIWHYLQQAPLWLVFIYATILAFVALFPLWLLLKINRKKSTHSAAPSHNFNLDESGLNQHLITEQQRGVDTQAAESELSELNRRRDLGLFHLTLFGHASSGKSSLIKALMPNSDIETDVIKGTTTSIQQYQYGQLMLADVPGFDAVDQVELTERALEEAQRAHVVVFLLDGDLSRTEMNLFHALRHVNKPMVLALNKIDLYDEDQKQALTQAIEDKTRSLFPVVRITTGGQETLTVQKTDGTTSTQTRPRASDIKPLIDAIEQVIAGNESALHRFRDAGFLMLAEQKLNQASQSYNDQKAKDIIQSHTHKAIVGALASVAPGSDLVIQGTIGTQLVRSLCQLYQVEVNQLQIDTVLKATGGKLKTSTSLILAISGNALKSFPGLGTAAGGIMHAVAYGLIFNSLGQAVHLSLQQHGQLDSEKTQKTFEELLIGSSHGLAKDLAKMALKISRKK
ncbi:Era-like GTP-binding protein [Marinicella rhabdoformis]|uniref:Era-like GTP-binding protein n=1 Tax=Marinicella rhabdoformis TaxID=2580566 RepID=UPI0012AED8FD|nr:Era-like GTP-binding protein [Marinicella rhabdoformis]